MLADLEAQTMTNLPEKRIAVKTVKLHRGEGGPIDATAHRQFKGPEALKLAQIKLGTWGITAPKAEEGGYDKTDFTVIWENGDEYRGRFDLQYGGFDCGRTLADHIYDNLRFYAGTKKPDRFTDEQYYDLLARTPANRLEARNMLHTRISLIIGCVRNIGPILGLGGFTIRQARVTIDSCKHCPHKKHTVQRQGPRGTPPWEDHVLPLCVAVTMTEMQVQYQGETTGWYGEGAVLPTASTEAMGHGGTKKLWHDTNELPDWCPYLIEDSDDG